MMRPLLKILLYFGINVAIYAAAAVRVERDFQPTDPGTAKQVLYFVPKDSEVDLVLLGSSRGRVFSEYGNHGRVEDILGRTFVNLSRDGAGIVPAKVLLSYFYARGNHAKNVFLSIDYFSFGGEGNNESHGFLDDEPLRPGIIPSALGAGMRPAKIFSYLVARFGKRYRQRELLSGRDDAVLPPFTIPELEARFGGLLFPGTSPEFERHVRVLEDIVKLARSRGAQVRIVFLPSAYNPRIELAPGGVDLWLRYWETFRVRHGVPYHDYRNAVKELKFYSSPEHLNTAGVADFTQRHLKPLLR